MSKKRDRHLMANDADEIKFQIEEDRRIYEKNRNKSKAASNPWRVSRGGTRSRTNPAHNGSVASFGDGSCLWSLAKFVLIPIALCIFVAILKSCS